MKDFEELMALSPSSKFAVFTYYCDNLGDHIQTLAILQHVRPRELLPRDNLTPHPDLYLVANGWLTSGALPQAADFRGIKYVGIHIAPHLRIPKLIEALRPCGVIGCRDIVTAGFLSEKAVPNRLTRCATLTFPTYHGKRDGVYCVDVPAEIYERAIQLYKDPIRLSHDLDQFTLDQVNDEFILEQYRKAYGLLMQYRKAELVITTRVHAALPCIAFGTPVIYVGVSEHQDDRVSVFSGLGVTIAAETVKQSPARGLQKPAPLDATPFRACYLEFLRGCLGKGESIATGDRSAGTSSEHSCVERPTK